MALLLLSACSGPPGPQPTGSQSPTRSSAPAPASSTLPAPVPPGPGPAEGPTVAPGPGPGAQGPGPIVWLGPGPASRADPPAGVAYVEARELNCNGIRTAADGTGDQELWLAVAGVCDALVAPTPGAWAHAAGLVSAVPTPPAHRCLDAVALSAARAAVVWGQANAGWVPSIARDPADACPRRVTGGAVVDDAGAVLSRRLAGPAGTLVRLDGFYVNVQDVVVGGVPGTGFVSESDFGPVTVAMPDGVPPGTSVRVTLVTDPPTAGWVDFLYTAPPGSGSTGSPTGPPEPSATASGSASVQPSPTTGPDPATAIP